MREENFFWRAVACLLLSAASLAALGQATNVARVSGQVSATDTTDFLQVTFSCTGTPTCTGTYAVTTRDQGCSNSFSFGGTITITGLDLSFPHTISGSILPSTGSDSTPNSNGTCTYTTKPSGNQNIGYSANWNGSTGILSLTGVDNSGKPISGSGTFTASLPNTTPPVFPMTVTSNVTPTTATATAQVAPRAQDVGTTQSVFVFAHAPASVLRKSIGKEVTGPSTPLEPADDSFCVLSQLNSSGQLAAVSASTMQAFTTGVLSSQSQAVNILNNTPTANVAGATFYVGYGSSAASMLSNGVYQDALSVPGASQCTASLAAAPAPNTPGPLSGLWWNANESGWGIHFTQRRNIVFAAWYTYDANGNPKWYVASNCTMPAGVTGATGSCTGTLYDVKGPTFFGTAFNPSLVNVTTAGNLQVNFADANTASMTYTVAGVTRTVPLTRQPLASGTTPPAVDYTDLWWNSDESGWGMAIAQQYGVMFLAWYVYDNTGKPFWYVASNCLVTGSICSGTLYRTTGPAFGPTFDSTRIQVFTAGTMSVTFTDANNGLLTYAVNGVTATKTIKRQVF